MEQSLTSAFPRSSFWPGLPLRLRVWDLRSRLGAGDALFVALAEALREPLVTRDAGSPRASRV